MEGYKAREYITGLLKAWWTVYSSSRYDGTPIGTCYVWMAVSVPVEASSEAEIRGGARAFKVMITAREA